MLNQILNESILKIFTRWRADNKQSLEPGFHH